jgi:hypothetical protein
MALRGALLEQRLAGLREGRGQHITAWKVVEVWDIWDAAGVMRQMGAIPTTG